MKLAYLLLEDEEEPPIPPPVLLDEEPPLMPPVLLEEEPPLGLLDEEPLMPPEDELPMPPPLELVEPVPDMPELGLELLELDEPDGVLGVVLDVVDDEEEPPGTTTVSFSFVVELVLDVLLDGEVLDDGDVLLPPGTTVVVSFFSHAESAKAPMRTSI